MAGPVDGLDGDAARKELSLRLAQVVAATLGNGASAAPRTATSSQAQGLAANYGKLVFLAPKVNGARFEVVADVSEVPRNFWARTRGVKPSSIQHAFVQQPLDAELRSFLPRPPLVVTRVDKAKHAIQTPVAIACGDIDDDQGLELLVVGRHELGLGRLRDGRFVPRATARWSDLSPVAPAPSRQVMASAWIGAGQARVGTSDRAHAVVLGPDLRIRQSLGHLVPWAPSQCAMVSSTTIVPTPVPCETALRPSAPNSDTSGVHAVAGAQISRLHAPPFIARATFDADTDQAILRDGNNREVSLSEVGAQIAVGDVDGDGQAELITSRATLEPAKDALDVHTWATNGRLVRRFSVPAPRGIAALAVCPAEDLGLAPIVVATSDELWVVR